MARVCCLLGRRVAVFVAALSLVKLLCYSGLSVHRCWCLGPYHTHGVKGSSGKLSDHAGVARGHTGLQAVPKGGPVFVTMPWVENSL